MNKKILIVAMAFLASCGANYSIPAGDNSANQLTPQTGIRAKTWSSLK